jgi:hypothetical protein
MLVEACPEDVSDHDLGRLKSEEASTNMGWEIILAPTKQRRATQNS